MKKLLLTFPVLLFLAGSAGAAQDRAKYPERPADGQFIVDEMNLLEPGAVARIELTCEALLREKKIPILVVTIPSLAKYQAMFWDIERYARNLFDEWGIGFKDHNYGILLLVSVGDRKARIQLGDAWGRSKDDVCQRIMDDWIIANFKKGKFSEGIRSGVEMLDKMAREIEVPSAPVPPWVYLVWIGAIGLAIFTVVSLVRRGSSGWAWVFWGVVFAVIGALLVAFFTSRSSGSGWSGGSFGGGFSGGGGATGSW